MLFLPAATATERQTTMVKRKTTMFVFIVNIRFYYTDKRLVDLSDSRFPY